MLMLNYPTTKTRTSIYGPRLTQPIGHLNCKMGAEDLNVQSVIRDHGLYLFDLSPMKQPGGRNMRFKEIRPQQLEFSRDMWQLSRAKVAVTMGRNPASAVVHLFEKRILFAGDVTHLLLNEADDSL